MKLLNILKKKPQKDSSTEEDTSLGASTYSVKTVD